MKRLSGYARFTIVSACVLGPFLLFVGWATVVVPDVPWWIRAGVLFTLAVALVALGGSAVSVYRRERG